MTRLYRAHMEATNEELHIKVVGAPQSFALTDGEEITDLVIYLSDIFLLWEGIL